MFETNPKFEARNANHPKQIQMTEIPMTKTGPNGPSNSMPSVVRISLWKMTVVLSAAEVFVLSFGFRIGLGFRSLGFRIFCLVVAAGRVRGTMVLTTVAGPTWGQRFRGRLRVYTTLTNLRECLPGIPSHGSGGIACPRECLVIQSEGNCLLERSPSEQVCFALASTERQRETPGNTSTTTPGSSVIRDVTIAHARFGRCERPF